MGHESGRGIRKVVGVKLRECVLGAVLASALVATAHAEPAALTDAVNLTIGMRQREIVSATLPTNAKKLFPSLTANQVTCVKAFRVGPVVSSYTTAIRTALTKEEVARAQTFYNSAEGKSYVSKLVSSTQASPASLAPAVTLTSAEQTALNSFLATTAGQKLIKNKSYMTAELNTQVNNHISWIVKGCPA